MSGVTAMTMMTYAAVASAAMGAVSMIVQGNAAAAQQESAANAANYNAAVAGQNAQSAIQAANANEEAQRRKAAGDQGRLRAGMAENGIGLDSGTASDLTEQSSMNAELDALNIRYQGATQAQAYRSQGKLDTMQADQASSNAGAAMTSGFIGAGASALSAYGKYAGMQSKVKSPFIGG